MNVHWFSPLPPSRSGIALHTMALLPALAERCRLTLWTDQDRWDPCAPELAQIRHFRAPDFPWPELNAADLVVYNLGNHPLHEGMWEISRRHSGIVVMHDLCMQDFFTEVFLNRRKDIECYVAEMAHWYGSAGAAAARRFIADPSCIAEASRRFPLRGLAAENALGIVIHTPGACEEMAHEGLLPLIYVPLPPPWISGCGPTAPPPPPPYRLIAFGLFGSNRRLESLFEAWAGLEQPDLLRMDLCGEFLDQTPLEYLKRSPVSNFVTFHGYVPEPSLRNLLGRAHLAINLRWPAMGEASGTQLIIWQHALPSLVTRTGWYESCPADTVLFVRPEEEVHDIREHLRALVHAPEDFRLIGERGREWVNTRHNHTAYVEALLSFGKAIRSDGLRNIRLHMADRVSAEASGWLPAEISGGFAERVSGEIAAISEVGSIAAAAGR